MKNKIYPFLTVVLVAGLLSACNTQKPNNNNSSSSQSSQDEVLTEYTITFNPCNGNPNDIIRLKGVTGTVLTLPQCGALNGQPFLGWSTKYSQSRKMGDQSAIVTSYTVGQSNAVLYACYSSAEVGEYMENLKRTSTANHLYYHYYRFNGDYAPWDVWAWPYKPKAGEGAKFDWVTSLSDSKGGACIDIDLSKDYDGGWNAGTHVMGGTNVNFTGSTQVGLQIVQSASRNSDSGFWVNDSGQIYVALENYALELTNGGVAYHIFVVQDNVQEPSAIPADVIDDPFADDDGTNTTYNNPTYDNVNWNNTANKTATASDFKDVGVGYQIMVSSFADSDGDGFGDIYGITNKLSYLNTLGVNAIWLTPIQLSDSYHGYDITDYEMVDPKFGSIISPAAIANGGEVTSETALADYRQLIDAAHDLGIKVVMDLVLNHTSTANKWFVKSANLDDEYRGYYQWGNHETTPGQINENKCWYPYGDHPYSYYAKFGSSMPELNFSYKTTREAVEDMSVFWAKDVGVDGFRLDAVKHIYMSDESTPKSTDTIIYDKATAGDYSSNLSKNLHFFRELKATVTQKSQKDVFFVGENFDGHAYHVAPYYEAFDSMFDFYTYYNLTSSAATGRTNTNNKFGTVSGFMNGGSQYLQQDDSSTEKGAKDAGNKLSYGSKWNYPSVYGVYNNYRGDTSLPGSFTSNHDIARVINRIAGSGDATGLSKQGNVTTDTYATFEQSANCVKIAELMFPGVTWIYYGDEIGMTGNFPAGKDADSDFADLWYRQPMKWTANQSGEYMTDYYVTGSNMKVQWDNVNSTSTVVPANTQMSDPNSDFSLMKQFVTLKTSGDAVSKALCLGSMESIYVYGTAPYCDNILSFKRSYNGATVTVVVNFNNYSINSGLYNLSGQVLASYNGATASKLPAYSAVVLK